MEQWLRISSALSKSGTYKFIHNSTASVIQLIEYNAEGEKQSEIWMDYYQWGEFCDIIKELTKEI